MVLLPLALFLTLTYVQLTVVMSRNRLHSSPNLLYGPRVAVTQYTEDMNFTILMGNKNKAFPKTAPTVLMAGDSEGDKILRSENAVQQTAFGGCKLTLAGHSKSRFHYGVVHKELNLVYSRLKFPSRVNLTIDKMVIGGDIWTWTYFGNDGGFYFLQQPVESSIWSFGLLKQTVGGIIELELETNCSMNLHIGDDKSAFIIGTALKDIMNDLYTKKPDYEANYWCYKKRRYIAGYWLYMLCLHVVCPIQYGEYRCCVNHFAPKKSKRELDCGENNTFVNDYLWYIPFATGCIFCLNMPLFVFWFAWKISPESSFSTSSYNTLHNADDSEDGLRISGEQFIFLTEENAVSLLGTIFSPCSKSLIRHPVLMSRLKRIFFVFLSLSCIAAQLLLDSLWIMNDFVADCVEVGIPMGFRSLRTGYKESSHNFLPCFGGPVVALSLYVLVSVVCIVFPVDIPAYLGHGHIERRNKADIWTPLLLGEDLAQRLSSIHPSPNLGYRRYIDLLQMNMYCILNCKFWTIGFRVQKVRFTKLPYLFLKVILFFPYVALCICEDILCIIFYGFPLFSYVLLVLKAYSIGVLVLVGNYFNNKYLRFLLRKTFLVVIISAVLFHTAMLCTIFLDAVIFIARVFVYSYQGIVLFPKTSYGYLIFLFTIVYYIIQIKDSFGKYYQTLLRRLIKMSSKHKAIYIDGSCLVKRQNCYQGMPVTVFNEVAERIRPKRVEVFTSLMKIVIVLFMAIVTTHMMLYMNKFKSIHVLVHVGTTLFICALPKLLQKVYKRDNNLSIKKLDEKILKVLKDFVTFDEGESQNTATELKRI